jgi:hypothetical protein
MHRTAHEHHVRLVTYASHVTPDKTVHANAQQPVHAWRIIGLHVGTPQDVGGSCSLRHSVGCTFSLPAHSWREVSTRMLHAAR